MMLKKRLKITVLITLAVATSGCIESNKSHADQQVCSNDWYLLVEKQLSTGDGQGHGPDLGSVEWRSTVEFKLGVRGKPGIPALETEQWCSYINEHFIKPTT